MNRRSPAPTTGTQPGSVTRWLARMTATTTAATTKSGMIARKSRRCLRIAASLASRRDRGVGRRLRAGGPVEVRARVAVAGGVRGGERRLRRRARRARAERRAGSPRCRRSRPAALFDRAQSGSCSRRRPSGSARTGRCRRGSGPRRRARRVRRRTPCSSRRPSGTRPGSGRHRSAAARPWRSARGGSVCGSSRRPGSSPARGRAWRARACRPGRPARSGATSRRVCAIQGNAPAIVAGVSRTPGRISRAKGARRRERRVERRRAPGCAVASVGPSAADRRAQVRAREPSEAIVVLKFVTRSLSWPSLRASPSVARPVPRMSRARSASGCMPRSASATSRSRPAGRAPRRARRR